VAAFLPDLIDPALLRTLALAAVDAAHHAGADYADVRLADTHQLGMAQGPMVFPFSWMGYDYAYGVRVRVGGAWSFAFGTKPNADAIARAAISAVATARGLSKVADPHPMMAPAPVVHGEWSTPVTIDPFAISPNEHAQLLGGLKDTAERVSYSTSHRDAVTWTRETRVFASTEGSLITQHFMRVNPDINVSVGVEMLGNETVLPVPGIGPASAGVECLLGPALHDAIKEATESAAKLSKVPERDADVGRFDAILDGTAIAMTLGTTLAPALGLERALGYDADGAGTSFLAPVEQMLGEPLFASQLTMRADRSLPSYGAAQWDDEGVPTTPFTLVDQGRVVDYFTTRATAPVLASWYEKRGTPMQARGAAVSWVPTLAPTGCASQLFITPGARGATFDTMLRTLGAGVAVLGMDYDYSGVGTDQQLAGGSLIPRMLYNVKQGQITHRLRGAALRFSTKRFWKSLTHVGDATTVQQYMQSDLRSDGTWTMLPIAAPAALVHQLDVAQVGGRS